MAAEKLTRARLAQILVLLAVLMTAFVWRTVTYENTKVLEDHPDRCQITAESCVMKRGNHSLGLSLSPFPVKANTETLIHVRNANVKPVATVAGVEMFMGKIPVVFEQGESGWVGRFQVPECVHNTMKWAVTIQAGETQVIADFIVKK
ncbi:hypothetical protein [Photobacterium atrarenae]|uniref:Uncharacterized protein n=1 Tax=Photobacterium atrarenae TaxID=865757 RepID=A0ABY5GJ51_9GAMM|nr:hypothetical protein [Photobacterium atrarenae]UTV29129.1 hypothetical protein NNL38_07870 [Photobacterium atrarenae]